MKTSTKVVSLLSILTAGALLATAYPASRTEMPAPQEAHRYAYHDHPSSQPLPDTLDAAQFEGDHMAFVCYSLAHQIRQVLYQVPCHCPCDKKLGHESLLDCYVGKHGVGCPTCQKELLFCFLQSQKGKSPAQIRDAIAKGKAWKLDLVKYTERLYLQLQGKQIDSHE